MLKWMKVRFWTCTFYSLLCQRVIIQTQSMYSVNHASYFRFVACSPYWSLLCHCGSSFICPGKSIFAKKQGASTGKWKLHILWNRKRFICADQPNQQRVNGQGLEGNGHCTPGLIFIKCTCICRSKLFRDTLEGLASKHIKEQSTINYNWSNSG